MITLPYRRDAENKDTEMEKDDREKIKKKKKKTGGWEMRYRERKKGEGGGGVEFYIKIIKCSPGEMEMDGRKEKE